MVSLITFDVDWAPDFILEDIAEMLNEYDIKTTWFFTHKSNIIKKFRKNKNFELGIHPNFLANSTQGKNPHDILTNLKKIIPNAESIRTHSLFQASTILSTYKNFGLKQDVSIFLYKSKNIEPHLIPAFELYRIPYYWEDDCEMCEKKPNWKFSPANNESGLRIYNFHPIHVALNSKNLDNYQKLKNKIGLHNLDENNIKQFVNIGKGTRTMLFQLITYLKTQDSLLIKDIKNLYK